MHRDVTIPIPGGELHASFCEPTDANALVIFAHGSGSSRLSPRNRFVADRLVSAGLGTLLLDLLTVDEDRIYENRFDIPLLAKRLKEAVHWAKPAYVGAKTPVALFGASTGAAAALIAAADLDGQISALVSRGGRPDLAGEALRNVHCPTLLIVGEQDFDVLALNRQAMAMMPETTVKELAIVPGATHLFEEPGTLEQAADLAKDWFQRHAQMP
jgi:dienelactone hydrolase